jgi:hypothetical protein
MKDGLRGRRPIRYHREVAFREIAGRDPDSTMEHRPMARSQATTVGEYLAELPEDRRAVVAAVRAVVLMNLPRGYRLFQKGDWLRVFEVPVLFLKWPFIAKR